VNELATHGRDGGVGWPLHGQADSIWLFRFPGFIAATATVLLTYGIGRYAGGKAGGVPAAMTLTCCALTRSPWLWPTTLPAIGIPALLLFMALWFWHQHALYPTNIIENQCMKQIRSRLKSGARHSRLPRFYLGSIMVEHFVPRSIVLVFALIELYRRPCKLGLTTKTLLVWFVIWFALLSVATGFFLRTFGGNSLTRVWQNNLSTGIIIVAAALVIIWLSLLVAPSLATARSFLPTCYQAVNAACISFALAAAGALMRRARCAHHAVYIVLLCLIIVQGVSLCGVRSAVRLPEIEGWTTTLNQQ
jgi:hypothetical protein